MFEDVKDCDEHRRDNGLMPLSQAEKERTVCGEQCPVADTCELRKRSRTLQDAFGDSEWC